MISPQKKETKMLGSKDKFQREITEEKEINGFLVRFFSEENEDSSDFMDTVVEWFEPTTNEWEWLDTITHLGSDLSDVISLVKLEIDRWDPLEV
jgi:hypothetical protein